MNDVKVVLFDLGNVLVHVDTDMIWKELGVSGDPKEPYVLEVHRASQLLERGEVSDEDFFHRLYAIMGGRFSEPALRAAAERIIGVPVTGMDALVARTANRVRTGLLSNTNPLHYEYSVRTVPALRHLPRHFLSYQLGAMKPSAEIYRKVIAELDVAAGEIVFFDDSEANVKGAVDAGLRAVVFHGVGQAEELLKGLGVLE